MAALRRPQCRSAPRARQHRTRHHRSGRSDGRGLRLFALGDQRAVKLFGVATATAVLLDAIVIRSTLLPAVLELTGRRTWAFPRWFDRRPPRLAIDHAAPMAPIEEAT